MAATITLLGSTFNTTSGTHTVVATPAVNDLIVIVRANTGNTTSHAPTDNNSSGTYTKITSALKASSADLMEIYVRDSLVGSASSTTFTDAAGTTTGGGLAVYKITGMSAAGLSAVRQSAAQANQSAATTPTPVFSSTTLSVNPIIGAVFNATSAATLTPRTNFTEDVDTGYSTPTTGFESMHRNSGETSTSLAWGGTSASAFCDVAVEFQFDTAPSAPTLSSPANAGTVASTTPTFQWSDTDPDSDKMSYEVQVATDSAFTNGSAINTGAVGAGTFGNDATVGTFDWTSPSSAGAEDGVFATIDTVGSLSHYLTATNFGFSVPASATINGIVVEVKRKSSFGDAAKDNSVKLIKGGTVSGTDKAVTATAWPSALTYTSYGGSSDLWGLTLAPSDVNNSTFGFAISGNDIGDTGTDGSIDYIRMTVYYTPVASIVIDATSSANTGFADVTTPVTPSISHVQKIGSASDNSLSSFTITPGSGTTAGNDIIVAISWYVASGTYPTCVITDSVGNTYNTVYSVVGSSSTGPPSMLVVQAHNTNSLSTSNKITATFTGTAPFATMTAHEFSGISSILDGSVVTASGTGTTVSFGTGTTTNAVDAVLAFVAPFGNLAAPTWSTGWSSNDWQSAGPSIGLAWQLPTSTGSFSGTATIAASEAWNSALISLQGSVGDPFTSGDSVSYTVQGGSALTNGSTYYWRVRGIDPAGSNTYGSWSATDSFTVSAGGGGTTYTQSLTGGLSPTGTLSLQNHLSKTLTGLLSFSGAITRSISHKLSASVSPSGAISRQTNYILSGGLSFTGSLVRSAQKIVAGTLSLAGAFAKFPQKTLTGSLSFSTVFLFQANVIMTAALNFSGSVKRSIAHSLTGGLSFVGNLVKMTPRAFSGALSFVGGVTGTKIAAKVLSGTLSFSGAIVRRTGKSLTGGLSFVGSAKRFISHAFTGALGFTGSFVKKSIRAFAGGLSFVGSMIRQTRRPLAATISFSTVFLFQANVIMTAALNFSGAMSKRTTHSFTAALSFVGSLATILLSNFTQNLTAALSFVGSTNKQTTRAIAGVLNFNGSFVKRAGKALVANLTPIGALAISKFFIKAFTASLSFSGGIGKGIRRAFTAALSFVGLSNRNHIQSFLPPLGIDFTVPAPLSFTVAQAAPLPFTVAQPTPIANTVLVPAPLEFNVQIPSDVLEAILSQATIEIVVAVPGPIEFTVVR